MARGKRQDTPRSVRVTHVSRGRGREKRIHLDISNAVGVGAQAMPAVPAPEQATAPIVDAPIPSATDVARAQAARDAMFAQLAEQFDDTTFSAAPDTDPPVENADATGQMSDVEQTQDPAQPPVQQAAPQDEVPPPAPSAPTDAWPAGEGNAALMRAQARLAGRRAARFVMGQLGRRYRRNRAKYLIFGAGATAVMFMAAPTAVSVIGGGIAAKAAITRFARYRRGVDARAVRRNDPVLSPDVSWAEHRALHEQQLARMVQSAEERVIAKLPGDQRRKVQVDLARIEVLRAQIAATERGDAVRRQEGLPDGTVDVMASRRASRRLRHEQQLEALTRGVAPVMAQAQTLAFGEFSQWAQKVRLVRASSGLADLTGPDPSQPAEAPAEPTPARRRSPARPAAA